MLSLKSSIADAPPDWGRGFAVWVWRSMERAEVRKPPLYVMDSEFKGFESSEEMLGEERVRELGAPKGSVFHRRIEMDDRATAEQVAMVWKLRPECFTRMGGCHDAREMVGK